MIMMVLHTICSYLDEKLTFLFFPTTDSENPSQPVVAKCNLAVLLSLKNMTGIVIQRGKLLHLILDHGGKKLQLI